MGPGASFSSLKRYLAAIIVAGRLPSELGVIPTYSVSCKIFLEHDTISYFKINILDQKIVLKLLL